MMGAKRCCGVHFEVLLPPVLDTSTPVLITHQGGTVGSHPMGTLAGPVIEGRSVTQPVGPMPPMAVPMQMPPRIISNPCLNDCNYTQKFTAEEWMKLQRDLTSQKMPISQ